MWCRHCQQQTPALGPPSANGPRCGRCQRTSPEASSPVGHAKSQATGLPGSNASDDVSFDPDEARRAIYRSLRSAHATISAGEAARTLRFDTATIPLTEAIDAKPTSRERLASPTRIHRVVEDRRPSHDRSQLAAWGLASVGAVGVGIGIGLGAWSLVGGRADLWNPALAAAIGGQGLLIIGLLQLLASIWKAARLASAKLSMMHDELRHLRRTTDESAGRSSATAAGFYADLARDAPPEMMLGNLRGQMDRLASRLRAG